MCLFGVTGPSRAFCSGQLEIKCCERSCVLEDTSFLSPGASLGWASWDTDGLMVTQSHGPVPQAWCLTSACTPVGAGSRRRLSNEQLKPFLVTKPSGPPPLHTTRG